MTTPSPQTGGASFATAYVTGILAAFLAEGPDDPFCEEYLRRIAVYHGPERRTSGRTRRDGPQSKVQDRPSPTSKKVDEERLGCVENNFLTARGETPSLSPVDQSGWTWRRSNLTERSTTFAKYRDGNSCGANPLFSGHIPLIS